MFTEALSAILDDHATPAALRRIEADGDATALWQAVTESGFLALMSPESDGGAGLALPDLFGVVFRLGSQPQPLPLAESIAARALVAPGTVLPDAPIALASTWRREPDGSLLLPRVPDGVLAGHVLAADGTQLWRIDARDAECRPTGGSVGWEAAWRLPPGQHPTLLPGRGDALPALAAAVSAALIAGAASRCLELTLAHANQRVQFGKPLGKFQAVQQQLSVMAEHVAAATVAAEAAFQPGPDGAPQWLPCAIAKARTSEAVVLVAQIAHALHGAIGVTQEYDLQLYTRRLRAWRVAHGSEDHWQRRIGQAVLADPRSVLNQVRG